MAEDGTQTEMTTTANVLSYLVATARTGFTVPSEEGEGALYMLAKFADQTPEQMMETLQSDSATETLFDNDRLHTNLEIHSLIAGEPSISSILLNEGYNAYALHSNEAFQQLAHRIYDLDHGENAWQDRVRSEIEEIHGRDMSDAEYAARHELLNIAGEHGTQSDAFLTASKSYYELYPSNIRNREIEVNVRQYRDRVAEIERRIENIQSDDRLSPEDKESYLFAQEISLTEAQQSHDIWAERWGQRMIRPIEKHDTPMRLAETLYERVTETDEFIVLARERYDALHFDEKGPNAWDQHFAELQAEYEASWFGSEPDYAAELTEWGQGHIDEKMGLSQFDLDKLAEHGVDTGIFDTLDGQTLLEDDEMLDVSSRFGTAWLQASEIAYDGRNGREPGAWATHFKDELTQAAGRTDSTSEARAIQELIAVADEHGSTSAEMMEAESAFLERFPNSVGSEAILDLNKELANEGEWALSYQDGNIGSALITDRYRSDEYKAAVSYLIKLDAYTEYEWFKDLSRDVAVGITDPTQYVVAGVTLGAGFYSGGTAAPVTAAGATTARAALVRGLTSAAAVSAVEGGVTEYSLGIINQKLDQELGVRESISQAEATTRGAFGAGMGSILGVGFFSAGRMTRRVFGTSNTPVDIPLTESNIPRVSRDGTVSAPDLTTAAARPVEAPETVTADIDVEVEVDVAPAAAAATPTATPRVTASDVVGIRDRLVNFARGFVADEAGGISDTLASFGLAPLARNIKARLHAATAEPDIDGPAPRAPDAEGPAAGADAADGAARDGDAPEAGADAADGAARDGDAPEADADGPAAAMPNQALRDPVDPAPATGRRGSRTNSRSVAHFHDNIRKSVKAYTDALRAPLNGRNYDDVAAEALQKLQSEVGELRVSLARMGHPDYKRGHTLRPEASDIAFGSYESGNNLTQLQKDGLDVTLNQALDLGEMISTSRTTQDQVTAFMQEVTNRVNRPNDVPLEIYDGLIMSSWKFGRNEPDDSGNFRIGMTNFGQINQLRYQIEEASNIGGRYSAPSRFPISNEENIGGGLRKVLATIQSKNNPEYHKELAREIVGAIDTGMTTADILYELNSAVSRADGMDGVNASNPFPDFPKTLREIRAILHEKQDVDGNKVVSSTLNDDGTITINDPAIASLLNRLNIQDARFWRKNYEGSTVNFLLGTAADGTSHTTPRRMRAHTVDSLAPQHIESRYRKKSTGELSASGTKLTQAKRARFFSALSNFLTGGKLDTVKTIENIAESPSAYHLAWKEAPEGESFKRRTLRRGANIIYRLAGGDVLPFALKFAGNHRLGGRIQYLKHSNVVRAAYGANAVALGSSVAFLGASGVPIIAAAQGLYGLAGATGLVDSTPSDDSETGDPSTEATVSRVDPTTARGNLAKTLISQWAAEKFQTPSGLNTYFSSVDEDHEARISMIVAEAAVLLEQDYAKPVAERNPVYNGYDITPGSDETFEEVWAEAEVIYNAKVRAANIENTLVSTYQAMFERDETYDPRTGAYGENFDAVLAMLIRDPEITQDPLNENLGGFISKVGDREGSLSLQSIENRTAAALKGFADDRSVTLNDVTDAEIRAAQILANQFDLASNDFHSVEFLSGAAGSDLRTETLEQATTVLTREVAAAEATARTQAALTAFANDRGARIEDLTAAEKEAAEMLAESGQSLDFISGNTAESKNYRQVLLDGATEALTAIQQTPSGGGGSGPNIRDVDFPQGPGAMTNALGNALNWATDGDNDGYGAIITHPVGQAISATAIATGKSLSRGFGAISDDAQGWLKYAGIGLGGAFMLRFLPGMGWTRNGLAFLIVAGLVGVLASKATHGGLDNAFADDGDGSTGDGSTGDGQGDGGFLAPDAVGHQVRTMAHDGQLPQIITITGDFDDDGDMDFINFFDKDRDGIYAAQMQGQSGKESFASAEIFTSAFIQGKFDLSPSNMALSTGTAKAGTDIQFGFIPHSSSDSISAGTLEIGDRNFMLDDRLDRDMTAGVLKGIEDANVPQTSLIQ